MKTKLKKLEMILFFVVIAILTALVLTACSQQQKEEAVRKYGEKNAFTVKDGKRLRIGSSNVAFYIQSSVNGEYYAVSEYAIAKANAVSSRLNINNGGRSNSKWQFTTTYTRNSINGNTRYTYNNGIIKSATITLNMYNLDKRSMVYKKHTALHEMGHAMGLAHINANEMKGYTVMMTPHPNESKYQMSDYGEFDKYNLQWRYGK